MFVLFYDIFFHIISSSSHTALLHTLVLFLIDYLSYEYTIITNSGV